MWLTRVASTPPLTRLVLTGLVHLPPLEGWRHLSPFWSTAAWPFQGGGQSAGARYPCPGTGIERGSLSQLQDSNLSFLIQISSILPELN